jgi:cytidine deaminase
MTGAPPPLVDVDGLLQQALAAREQAYAPYSRFRVGAAVATDRGTFAGCNVENASYGLTMCAERVALGAAVAAGARVLIAVAVVGDTPAPIVPCGACRQVLREFGRFARVILANVSGGRDETTLEALLPRSFGPEDLGV